MNKMFKIFIATIILVLNFYSYVLCSTGQLQVTPKNDSISRLDYLEKKIDDNQRCYSDMINVFNIYLTIFLAIVGLSIAGAWWNNIRTSKDTVKKELAEAKTELSKIVLEQLGKNEDKHQLMFSTLTGQIYEAFARGYQEAGKINISVMWFARAFKKYYDKSEEYINEEHKGRIVNWILDCLEKMTDSLENDDANELNSICESMNDQIFGVQKKKILARIESLSAKK